MKLPANPFLSAIRQGKPQIGIWISLGHAYAAEVIAGAGYDWALIDMEHTPNDLPSVLGQLQAFAASETTALVRPAWNDPVLTKQVLDMGPQGVLFPMVQSRDEAASAVAATRYPPRGIRGVAGTTRASGFGRLKDYYARVEEETAVLVQVETRAALTEAGRIGGTEGVDGVFFGPADIAADLGHLGQPMAAQVWDAILPVAKTLIANGLPVGTLVSDPEFARSLIGEGFTFVACGTDAGLLARGADALLAKMRG